ncbi:MULTISPECIES: efflux RND transporter periplasmic adaptor subunit [Agrobacterium]|uniref:efflux RND transporter periplasmic adaptor subunit n=1 Tax=Agrobacterium tumefaciens TaxID=358 RepID=UPI000EF1DA3D|nr:hypothetical protein At1D1108_50920 [Agrobacterium tumefaciens]NSY09833.1 efflux RND transporter periplasmic adaptor subunit [Agrobacterium tumefaciens]NSY93310.1 efflux RND transporter periplasmic adaptor subunit [Agrobacterium tumefaciens]
MTAKQHILSPSTVFALALILLGSSAAAQQADGAPPPAVSVVEIKPQTVALTYQYAARVSAIREVEVRARVGGILLKRNFVEGSTVKAGQVLFTLDPAPYEAVLAQAKAQLQQAEAQLSQAQREEKRNIALYEKNVGSEKSRDDAISARELAAASVAAARAQVQTAQLNLDYTSVTAPVDGVTSQENVSEGSLIGTTGDAGLLTSITQTDPVYINFSFSDSETAEIMRLAQSKISKGEGATLGVKIAFGDGSAYGHDGVVDFTSATIDKQTGTLEARAIVANPDRQLLPGQFVRATITGISAEDAIVIPEMALMQGPQGQFVYKVDNAGKAQVSPVRLGQKLGDNWLVLSGLAAGDKVITEGIIKVIPGAPVQATASLQPSRDVARN